MNQYPDPEMYVPDSEKDSIEELTREEMKEEMMNALIDTNNKRGFLELVIEKESKEVFIWIGNSWQTMPQFGELE